MKTNKSLGANAILNAIRTGLSILFPLITYPYALRILHADGIGRVNYAASIVSYFSMLASLGFSHYAIREGAKIRDDKEKFSRFASEIFSLNLITTAISFTLLILCVAIVPKFEPYARLILLLSTTILFSTFGFEWVNTVYEDFVYITIRTIVTELISMGLLFLMVRTSNDVYSYAFLTVVTQAVICISNYYSCRKYITIRITKNLHLKRHLKPILIFFANTVATTLYVNSDTTMLGWMEGDYYVGIYTASVKVYTVVKTMLSALYSAVVPRIAYEIGKGEHERVRTTYTSVFCDVLIILLPASTGLACISKEIITFMGGTEYQEGVFTLQLLSVSLIGAILNGLVTYCINIPTGKENINARATTYSAMINICLNLILIPMLKQNGAALTTAISEFFVLLYCIFHDNGEIKGYLITKKVKTSLLQAMSGVAEIVIISLLFKSLDLKYMLCMILIIVTSVIAYGTGLLLMNNDLAWKIMNNIKSILLKIIIHKNS